MGTDRRPPGAHGNSRGTSPGAPELRPACSAMQDQPAVTPRLPSAAATTQPHRKQPAAAQPQQPVAGTSDFEVVAEELAPDPTLTPTIRTPDWFDIRSESDDVAFPVIKETTFQPGLGDGGSSKPAVPSAPAVSWEPDDDDEDGPEDEEEAEYTALIDDDDELEILEDDDNAGSPPGPKPTPADEGRSSRVARRRSPRQAAGTTSGPTMQPSSRTRAISPYREVIRLPWRSSTWHRWLTSRCNWCCSSW